MTYKGPPPIAAPVFADVVASGPTLSPCEGCTTPRKCGDLGRCVGPGAGVVSNAVTTHDLKTWPEYFCPVKHGLKTFEVRYNDRDYKEGDRLYLREFIPCGKCKGRGYYEVEPIRGDDKDGGGRPCCPSPHGQYTGRQEIHVVSYILADYPGLQPGFVVLGLRPLFQGA